MPGDGDVSGSGGSDASEADQRRVGRDARGHGVRCDGGDRNASHDDGSERADDTDAEPAAEPDVVLTLPEDARDAFKEPLGPLYTDVEELLAAAGTPIVAVGDVVTFHLEEGGHRPAVAFVDGRTKRESAPERVREAVAARENRVHVANPAGTITADLLAATRDAIDAGGPTTVVVDGEEDLAAVPATLAAPDGATVVYGQPDEGMVAVDVTGDRRSEFRDLLGAFEGDVDRALALLEG